jgi:membrane AbrB-like protein
MPISVMGEMAQSWPLFIASVFSVIAVASAMGWAISRWKWLPGTTGVWGMFPGSSTAMVLMAESFGADSRLVALMQYLRVFLVGVAATSVARIWAPVNPADAVVGFSLIPAAAAVDWAALARTLALALGAAWIGQKIRLPAGAMLMPMLMGVLLQDSGLLRIELPWWLLNVCYAFVGWAIGLRFTREIVRYSATVLPRILLGTMLLIAICGGMAVLVARWGHVDPLTAYLSMSPGGADTVGIIANGSHSVNVPFVMAMQAGRFLLLAFFGPLLARMVAHCLPMSTLSAIPAVAVAGRCSGR